MIIKTGADPKGDLGGQNPPLRLVVQYKYTRKMVKDYDPELLLHFSQCFSHSASSVNLCCLATYTRIINFTGHWNVL